MRISYVVAAVAATVLAGCSSDSDEEAAPPPGALVSGTAEITVNDRDLGEFDTVQCSYAGPQTTITTGDDTSGSTAVFSSTDGLTAQSVSIRELGGFTGSYHQGIGTENTSAEVTLAGSTYTISGVADGFATDNPSFRTTGTFTIKVAC